MARPNLWLPAAALACAVFWMALVGSGAKLLNIYAHRGPQGFRHELLARIEQKINDFT